MWGELRAGSRKQRRQAGLSGGVRGGRFQQEEEEETKQHPEGQWKLWSRASGCPIRSLQTSPASLLHPELQQKIPLLSHPAAGTVVGLPESSCRGGQFHSPAEPLLGASASALAWLPADCIPLGRLLYIFDP